MENRPPQPETPRRPPNTVRKTNGSGGSPTPPWLWLIVIGLLALIFWHFVPKNEVQVTYYPWFIEQVESGNIKSDLDPGERDPRRAPQGDELQPVTVGHAAARSGSSITYVPSEELIKPLVERITQKASRKRRAAASRSRIDGPDRPAEPRRADWRWIMLLLPTFVILGLI